jgi:hypothetical protein
VLAALLISAAAAVVSWDARVDSTIARAHRHAANVKRPAGPIRPPARDPPRIGRRGGRPPGFDTADYRNRNVVERGFCTARQ